MNDQLRIHPGRLRGIVVPPPSKSAAHRALIAAWLAAPPLLLPSGLDGVWSDDLLATRQALTDLFAGRDTLDCGESGTTLRLLIPVAAALPVNRRADPLTFVGRGRLPERPLREYAAILAGHGVTLTFPDHDTSLPLRLSGQLRPGEFVVPGDRSSQFCSGLLLALPLLAGPSRIRLSGPLQSAPYVEMTLAELARHQIVARREADGFTLEQGQSYAALPTDVEKDYSQAAFWLVAAYGGSDLRVAGLPEHTAQGDQAILQILRDMAVPAASRVIDAAQIPDLVPILAVAAVWSQGVTRFTGAARLRLKESDRIASTAALIQAIGGSAETVADGLLVTGCNLSEPQRFSLPGGSVDAAGDHRIAMAAAIAALNTRAGVRLTGASSVSKSYPDFFDVFRQLGGTVDELHLES